MGPNPNVFSCGFQSGLAQVTVQVVTSTPLSRHHPCRDIDLMSRINLNLYSLQRMSTDVATSIPCRDITLCPCRFLLIAPDVATSFSCHDIISSLLQASDGCSGRRDINLLSQHQLNELQLSTHAFCCRDIGSMSRHHFIPL